MARIPSFPLSFLFACAAGALGAAALAVGPGCTPASAEWPSAHELPPDVRADYDVFALRCSKCHSLARPLNSGIDDDSYWQRYVARMRRQPGSGITIEDSVKILRFLHYYSIEQRKAKGLPVPPEPTGVPSSGASVAPPPGSGAAAPPPMPPPAEAPLPPPPPPPASPFAPAPPTGSSPPSP